MNKCPAINKFATLHGAFQAALRSRTVGATFSHLRPRSFWETIFVVIAPGRVHYVTLHIGKGHYSGDINDGGILTAEDSYRFEGD